MECSSTQVEVGVGMISMECSSTQVEVGVGIIYRVEFYTGKDGVGLFY